MAINPNIALSFQAPKFEDPLNKLAQMEQIKAYRQNALAKQMEMDTAVREREMTNALRQRLASGKELGLSEAAMFGDPGMKMYQSMAAAQSSEANRKAKELEMASKLYKDFYLPKASTVQTAEDARKWAIGIQNDPRLSAITGQVNAEEALAGLPQTDEDVASWQERLLVPFSDIRKRESQESMAAASLKSQEDRAAASLASQEARAAASLRSQEERARLQREAEQEKNKYARQLKEQELDPDFQQRMAEAKAKGKAIVESEMQAKSQLPNVIANTEMGIDLIDQLIGKQRFDEKGNLIDTSPPHKGFSEVVGAGFGTRFIPGTSGASADALLDQILGGAYLEAFETLKGGGQITEKEGAAATAARTRMSRAQSEEEFIKAAREYQGIIKNGLERARQKAGVGIGSLDEADAIVFGNAKGK